MASLDENPRPLPQSRICMQRKMSGGTPVRSGECGTVVCVSPRLRCGMFAVCVDFDSGFRTTLVHPADKFSVEGEGNV